MRPLYPEIEPHEHGMLDVGDGNLGSWETCGNPRGKPALVFHGGPGSGRSPWFRRLFDPSAYRRGLFDQRGCGRSTPHASAPDTGLATNTTWRLIDDAERLREQLAIERWLVLGGSWGSTWGLAYAEAHPDHVTEMILFGVTTGRRKEFDWTFRGGLSILFPEQWERLCAALHWCMATAMSSTPATDCSTILTQRSVDEPRTSGACGSPRHSTGLHAFDSPRDSVIPYMRWPSRGSLPTMSGTTPGSRTGSCFAASPRSRTSPELS